MIEKLIDNRIDNLEHIDKMLSSVLYYKEWYFDFWESVTENGTEEENKESLLQIKDTYMCSRKLFAWTMEKYGKEKGCYNELFDDIPTYRRVIERDKALRSSMELAKELYMIDTLMLAIDFVNNFERHLLDETPEKRERTFGECVEDLKMHDDIISAVMSGAEYNRLYNTIKARKRKKQVIKMRLQGTLEEIEKAVQELERSFIILSQSEPYKDRGRSLYYRVYVDVDIKK